MAGLAKPKLRTRAGGAAVPLDDQDRKLMNVMQSRFPLDPRPWPEIASLTDLTVADTMERAQRLLDKRIVREITPIFDTRALGYESMLVAAKIAVNATATGEQVAKAIDAAERRVRSAVPIARVIYLEPDLLRPTKERGERTASTP